MRSINASSILFCSLLASTAGCNESSKSSSMPTEVHHVERTIGNGTYGPKIEVDDSTFEGEIAEFSVRHRFIIKNVGDGLLKITDVASNCGCTTASLERREIAPGGSVAISATLDVSNGRNESQIFVSSNDKIQPTTALVLRAKQDISGNSRLSFLPASIHIVAEPGNTVAGKMILALTTLGGSVDDNKSITPSFDKTDESLRFSLEEFNVSRLSELAYFEQDKVFQTRSSVTFAQLGRHTKLWSVDYKIDVGKVVGMDRKIVVARASKVDPRLWAALGLLIEVRPPIKDKH